MGSAVTEEERINFEDHVEQPYYDRSKSADPKVRQLLESGDRHHLPAVNGDELAGIISWDDVLRVKFGDRSLNAILNHTYKRADLTNSQPVSIQVSGTVQDAANLLACNNFHSLSVVDGTIFVGIETSTDLIQYLVDQP